MNESEENNYKLKLEINCSKQSDTSMDKLKECQRSKQSLLVRNR